MKVTLERLPESRVKLHIEVDSERFEKSREAAYRKLAPRTRVPGFRPGKAPKPMTLKYIGESRLTSDAIDILIPDVYNEAIENENVDAIAQPELEDIQLDPVVLKFIVAVRPTVGLGDYKAIRVAKDPVEVTKEMLDEQILLLRRRHATQKPVARAAKWDDVITGDVAATAEGETFIEDEDAEFVIRKDVTLFVPGLAEAFVGMKKGDTKNLDITMPEDFRVERLAGKTAAFRLAVKEVKEEVLPKADDELAQMVNPEEFPTMAALTERLEKDLFESLDQQATAKQQQEAVDKLAEIATIDFPAVLVEREIDHLIQDSLGNDQSQYVAYLQRIGRSEAEYRATLREAAELRVKRSLVLNQLAEDEKIEVTDTDVDQELDTLVAPMGEDAPRFREMFATPEGIASIRRSLLSRKTLECLTGIVGVDGPAPKKAAAKPKATTAKAEADAPAKKPAAPRAKKETTKKE